MVWRPPVLTPLQQHSQAAELTRRCYDRQLADNIPCERDFANHALASAATIATARASLKAHGC